MSVESEDETDLIFVKTVLAMSKKAPPNTNFTTIWDVPHIFRLKEPQVGVCKIPDYISKKEQ